LTVKIDFHVHTRYSEDGSTSLRELLLYAKKQGLDGVAVTDHDTTLGARRLARQRQLLVIPGIEVSSLNGHVLALNVTENIPPKMSLIETVEKIHKSGGIAVIAHPSAVLKTGLGNKITSNSNLDAVEVINAAAFPFSLTTYLSRRLAVRLNLPQIAGSDAHHPHEIGDAYTEVSADSDREDVIEAVRRGETRPFGRPISWRLRFQRLALNLQAAVGGL
jgi:hypothetical protein